MTEILETLRAVRAQIEVARLAAKKATNPKEARRLRVWAAALERGLRSVERQETNIGGVAPFKRVPAERK